MTGVERIPPAPANFNDLRAFPREYLDPSVPVWRVHDANFGPWFFGSKYRFGLKAPNGTCYVSPEALTAIFETVIRGQRAIEFDDLSVRRIRRMVLPRVFEVANFLERRAAQFQVTRDFGTDTPYDRCQAWAEAFRGAGFHGIRYWARHDPALEGVSFALFARAGERRHWRKGVGEPLSSPYWVRLIEQETKVAVLGVPSLGSLTIVKPS